MKVILKIVALLWMSPLLIASLIHKNTPLLDALERDDIKKAFEILAELPLNAQQTLNEAPGGKTALHVAVQLEDPSLVAQLLVRGANPNAQTHVTKFTPLHLAVYQQLRNPNKNTIEIIATLVEMGADVSIKDHESKMPYNMLFAANAPIEPWNVYLEGGKSLHWDVAQPTIGKERIQELLQSVMQKNPNALQEKAVITGRTPLLTAIEYGRPADFVLWLIDQGANPTIGDNFGNNALFYAIKKNNKELLTQLNKKYPLLATTANNNRRLPFQHALSYHNFDTALELMSPQAVKKAETSLSSFIISSAWLADFDQSKLILKKMIEYGASLQDIESNKSLLYLATDEYTKIARSQPALASRFKKEVIDYLISKGAPLLDDARERATSAKLPADFFEATSISLSELLKLFQQDLALLR